MVRVVAPAAGGEGDTSGALIFFASPSSACGSHRLSQPRLCRPPVLEVALRYEACSWEQACKDTLQDVATHGIANLLPELALTHCDFEAFSGCRHPLQSEHFHL